MAQVDYIKYLRDIKELKVNWRTIKKHVDKTDWSENIPKRKKTPKLFITKR